MRPQFNAAVSRSRACEEQRSRRHLLPVTQREILLLYSGEGAHFVKKALDEAAEFRLRLYTGKASASAAEDQCSVSRLAEKSIPEYAAAKAAFAGKSLCQSTECRSVVP